jgi:hypothetical protein
MMYVMWCEEDLLDVCARQSVHSSSLISVVHKQDFSSGQELAATYDKRFLGRGSDPMKKTAVRIVVDCIRTYSIQKTDIFVQLFTMDPAD